MNERWAPIAGYDGFYEVSDLGRVKSLKRKCLCPQVKGGCRTVPEKMLLGSPWGPYLAVTLMKDGTRWRRNIQWLVADAFLGPKPSPELEVCHNDSNYTNNRWDNLRYDTRSGNFKDKLKNGTHIRGQNNPWSKLTDAQVVEIRNIGRSMTQQKVADMYGVGQATISKIILGIRFISTETDRPCR